MNEEELIQRFEKMKIETNGFAFLNSSILLQSPQNILILRLVLGYDQRTFSSILGKDFRSLRRWETLEMTMKPQTAEEIIQTLKILFSKIKPDIAKEDILLTFQKFTNKFGNRNLESSFDRGLIFAKEQKLSESETLLESILMKEKIPFEMRAIVQGLKRKYSIDFAIPDGNNPKFIIEIFDFGIKNKSVSYSKVRIRDVDQRFQMIKAVYPNVKTLLGIRFLGKKILEELAMKSLEREVINTDFIVLNNFENIPKIIAKYIY